MKILLAHSDKKLPSRESIDLWRIIRPFRELEKNVDWQIDRVSYLIPDELFDEESKVKTDELIKHMETLKDYDIIWTSYFPDAILFDVMGFMHLKYGTKFVLDIDDDLFNIPKHNNIWNSAGYQGVKDLQYMVTNSPYLVTSTEVLLDSYTNRRKHPTYLLPNYIGDDFTHKPFDNGEKIVIGYSGSVTHKKDLFDTGFIDALQQIMHKYKNVHVGTVGVAIDAYLPKARYTHHNGKPGQAYIDEIFPNINCDIAVAPIVDDAFNRGRSNIKWLEATKIPAAFIGSNIPPYKGTVKNGKTGLLTDNSSEGWYEALETLILDKTLRKQLIKNAQKEVDTKWSIEKNWKVLKEIVQTIHDDK